MELVIGVGASPGGEAYESLGELLRRYGRSDWTVTLRPPHLPVLIDDPDAAEPSQESSPAVELQEERLISVAVAVPGDTPRLAAALTAWMRAHPGQAVTLTTPGNSVVVVVDAPDERLSDWLDTLLTLPAPGSVKPRDGDAGRTTNISGPATPDNFHITEISDPGNTPPGPPFGDEDDEW